MYSTSLLFCVCFLSENVRPLEVNPNHPGLLEVVGPFDPTNNVVAKPLISLSYFSFNFLSSLFKGTV